MNIKKFATIAGLGIGMSLTAGHASAGLLIDRMQDDSIDFVLTTTANSNTSYVIDGTTWYIKNSGLIGANDVLISTFEIPSATVAPYPGTATSEIPGPGQEMTGISVTQATVTTSGLTFTPFASGMNSIITSGVLGNQPGIGASGDAGGGALIAFFINSDTTDNNLANGITTNTASDYNVVFDSAQLGAASNCANLAACIHQVTYGSLFQIDGYTGDFVSGVQQPGPNQSWVYTGTNNITTVLNGAPSQTFGFFNMLLGTFYNANGVVQYQNISTGLPCNGDGSFNTGDNCVQFSGTGNVRGGQGLTNGAIAHDDFTMQKYVNTPEPATMALLGMGLLGFGASRRRRV